MSNKAFIGVTLISIFLSGCISQVKNAANPSFQPKNITVSRDFIGRLSGNPDTPREEAFAEYETRTRTAADRKAKNYELLTQLILQSDDNCEKYLVDTGVLKNTYNTGLSITGSALTTAGTLSAPVRVANLLAGIGTFFNGAATTANNTLFGGKDYTLIYQAIKSGRAQEQADILKALNAGRYDNYSLGSIYILATHYNTDCGVNYGLAILNSAVSDGAAAGVAAKKSNAAGFSAPPDSGGGGSGAAETASTEGSAAAIAMATDPTA